MEGLRSHPSARPACDLCHARKVKCDRAENCQNCNIANAECRRTRPRRLPRARVSRFDVLKKRLEKLEQNTQEHSESNEFRSPAGSAGTLAQASETRETNQENERAETSIGPSLVSCQDESSYRAEEARQLIQSELEQNDGMGKDRKNVLRSALDFVSGFSYSPHTSLHDSNEIELEDDLEIGSTAPEMLYMMLPGIADAQTSDFQTSHWPDHITGPTLKKMFLYLIDNERTDTKALHYRVCVYSKAFFFLMNLQNRHDNETAQRLKKSQHKYKNVALASLTQLTFMSTPCLSLVQALLSGAMLMQYLGNMSSSWSLAAFASRTLMSLNLHAVETTFDLDEETQASLYWCYYLDRALSCLFVRQPSLPKLRIDPASMIPINSPNPFQATVKIMVEIAKLQEQVLDMQLDHEALADTSRVDAVIACADSLLDLVRKTRLSVPSQTQDDFDAAEFGQAALLANAFKCSRGNNNHQGRCLENSRRALVVLLAMLNRSDQNTNTTDQYPSFLTWTVLLFPLTPFFVLFCNVVASSWEDAQSDYHLLQNITNCLARFADGNRWIQKVYRLFHHFLILCDPLMEQNVSNLSTSYPSGIFQDTSADGNFNSAEENLLWELYDYQPSLDWFDIPLPHDGFAS